MSGTLNPFQEALRRIAAKQTHGAAAQHDTRAEDEINDYEGQKKKQDVLDQAQDRDERKKYANMIFHLIVWWLVGVVVILLLNGFSRVDIRYAPAEIRLAKNVFLDLPLYFHLSDSVLITVISGTTVNILGIFAIVAKYLFHRSK